MNENIFHITTLGCKLNIYESESISYILQSNGYIQGTKEDNPNLLIINTCTVTSKADSKCRNVIRRLKKEYPESLIIVCGCLVDTDINELKIILDVDIFIKNKNKDNILDAIYQYKNQNKINKPFIYSNEIEGRFNFQTYEMSQHSRAFIKIQDGCNNFCSYCKIPFARGQSISRDIDDIINEIENIIKNNYHEIVLTGINIGSYNFHNILFDKLLEIILNKFNQIRFRISSIEPQYITHNFLNLLKQYNNICSHLHIPLQSGSDKILKSMNRKYLTIDYYEIINKIKKIKNDIFLSTDLIVGYPDELDNEFEETLNFIQKIDFSFIHLFGFSPRIGTKAYGLKPKIPERIRDERIKIFQNIVNEKNLKYRQKFIGRNMEVIIEKKIKNNIFSGKSDNYLDFEIYSPIELIRKNKYKIIFSKIESDINKGEII